MTSAARESSRTNAEAAAAQQLKQSEERKQRREVEAIFRMMDTDSDGYLSVEEAHRLGNMIGIAVPERHSVHVKGVSQHQFMGWVFGLANTVEPSDWQNKVKQFWIYMKDRKGFITQDSLRKWMYRNKLECTDVELKELVEMMNSSDDERGISVEDLLAFYFNYKKL